ncbi:alpha/beta fold hydrolase [Gracilibacillus alcaliphilus]|uniref:alpha/beta fold hydrolase n=1 Tax=Gracilibacillus alcaliphilus TaxID=1401441 RepID=UPI0019562602|nr:alpha/beta hydrolase [Gracilibacillus alcaliphilus]MBM7675909.1 pimeloyl-ACP methyl ester carboxylesterase [Gracilibacillus alcaliphilus]
MRQGLIIETTDDTLTVLLVVHGGPGYPLYPIVKANKLELHKLFTVCYWDQRGTGMSYVDQSGARYSIFRGLKDVLMNRHYQLKEKINILKGSVLSYQSLGKTMAHMDLTKLVTKISIPVYIIHGKIDYLTTHTQALRFLNQLTAPSKKFFTFENSSHPPFIEEKESFSLY